MSVWCLLWLFMAVEINILYGFVSYGRWMIRIINLVDLRSVMAYYTLILWLCLTAIAIPHHCACTQLAYKTQLQSALCRMSPAHAECVMSRAWVRLRQILYGTGGLVSLWASVLWRRALQCFCWLNDQKDPHCSSLVVCHSVLLDIVNVFRGKHVPPIRGCFFLWKCEHCWKL